MWLIYCIDAVMLINVIIIVISITVKKYRPLRLLQTAAATGIVALFDCIVNGYAIATNKLDLGFPDWVYVILLVILVYGFVAAVVSFIKFKKSSNTTSDE